MTAPGPAATIPLVPVYSDGNLLTYVVRPDRLAFFRPAAQRLRVRRRLARAAAWPRLRYWLVRCRLARREWVYVFDSGVPRELSPADPRGRHVHIGWPPR